MERAAMTYPEVAAFLGVSERTVRRDVERGVFPRPWKHRGCVRFDRVEVEAFRERLMDAREKCQTLSTGEVKR